MKVNNMDASTKIDFHLYMYMYGTRTIMSMYIRLADNLSYNEDYLIFGACVTTVY